MLMKYAVVVTFSDGSKTGAAIKAKCAADVWGKVLELFNVERIIGVEVAAILTPERECRA